MVPVPEDLVMVTVAPPVVRLFPLASLACTVKVWVLVPLAVMLAEVGSVLIVRHWLYRHK